MATGTTIDELIIEIKADTKQLQSELKQINGKIKLSGAAGGAAFGGMAAGLGKMKLGAIAAVAGLAILAKGISSVAAAGSAFEDLKDSLDQVFGSIDAGDAAMQKVFKFAQTTPFQIEDATKAFIQLKSAGIEPSMEMLQTFADTASVSVDQLGTFEALVRMVQRGASGGMGLEELNMISDKGIDVLGILKEKLNLTKDDIAKFGKTAEGAAEMVKALTEGLQEKFGGAMESKMDNLSTKASNMVIAFKQLADEVFKSGLGNFLKETADFLAKIASESARIVRTVQGTATLQDFAGDTDTSKLTDQQSKDFATQLRNDASTRLNTATRNLLNFAESGSTNQNSYNIYQGMVSSAQKEFDNLNEIVKRLNRQIADKKVAETLFSAGSVEGLVEFQSVFKKLMGDTITETEKLTTQIEYLKGLLKTDSQEELQGIMAFLGTDEAGIQKVIDHLGVLKNEIETLPTMTDEMTQAIINASQAFTSDFVNSLLDGENALESFKNFARNIVSQIIAIFLQMAVVNQILNQVFGLTGANMLPTIGTPTATAGTVNPSTSVPTGFAGGGTVQKGVPITVNERGGEIFVPNSGGKILNGMNSKNSMGGETTIINQSINFATGVVPTVRAEVMKMMPQIAEVTKGAVAEAAMRGGSFRRALQGG